MEQFAKNQCMLIVLNQSTDKCSPLSFVCISSVGENANGNPRFMQS